MVDRASVDATVLRPRGEAPDLEGRSFRSRLELGAFAMPLTDEKEWLDFITLSLADWLHGLHHAIPCRLARAGEAARGGLGVGRGGCEARGRTRVRARAHGCET